MGSWLDIPEAAHCTYDGNAVTISREADWGDDGPFCTITIPS